MNLTEALAPPWAYTGLFICLIFFNLPSQNGVAGKSWLIGKWVLLFSFLNFSAILFVLLIYDELLVMNVWIFPTFLSLSFVKSYQFMSRL